MTEVLILCGGRGTRLKTISKGTPKPLVRFPTDNSYSILEQIIFRLKLVGLNSFTLVVNSINYSIINKILSILSRRPIARYPSLRSQGFVWYRVGYSLICHGQMIFS